MICCSTNQTGTQAAIALLKGNTFVLILQYPGCSTTISHQTPPYGSYIMFSCHHDFVVQLKTNQHTHYTTPGISGSWDLLCTGSLFELISVVYRWISHCSVQMGPYRARTRSALPAWRHPCHRGRFSRFKQQAPQPHCALDSSTSAENIAPLPEITRSAGAAEAALPGVPVPQPALTHPEPAEPGKSCQS